MRFTSIITAGIFAVAATAQSAVPSTTAKETPSATVSLTPEQSSSAACLEACGPSGDVACTSKCIAVPNPNDSQVNQTTDCVAKCPQGDGSEAQTNEFARCTQECISKYYFSAGGTPNPTTTADAKGPSGTSGSSSPKVTEVVETVTDKDGKTTESTKTTTMDSAATGSSEASETSGSAPPDSAGAMFAPVGLLAFFGAVLAL